MFPKKTRKLEQHAQRQEPPKGNQGKRTRPFSHPSIRLYYRKSWQWLHRFRWWVPSRLARTWGLGKGRAWTNGNAPTHAVVRKGSAEARSKRASQVRSVEDSQITARAERAKCSQGSAQAWRQPASQTLHVNPESGSIVGQEVHQVNRDQVELRKSRMPEGTTDESLDSSVDRLSSSQLAPPSSRGTRERVIKSKHISIGDMLCSGRVSFTHGSVRMLLKLSDELLPVRTSLRIPQDVTRIDVPPTPLPCGRALLRITPTSAWRSGAALKRFFVTSQPPPIDVVAPSLEACTLLMATFGSEKTPGVFQHCCGTVYPLHVAAYEKRLQRKSESAQQQSQDASVHRGEQLDQNQALPAARDTVDVPVTVPVNANANNQQPRQPRGGLGGFAWLWAGRKDTEDLCTFPPEGQGHGRGAVTVSVGDVRTLRPGEFLNDTIVDFWIKLLEARMTPHQRAQCHLFSSFFWKKLQLETEQGSPDPHRAVARWTRRVDIVTKRFLFVPICVSLHWRLAIVCQCPLTRAQANLNGPDCLDSHILYLDSLGGSMPSVGHVLSQYLRREWETRRGPGTAACNLNVPGPGQESLAAEFTDTPPQSPSSPAKRGVWAVSVPLQNNGSDCGLFVLEFMRRFVADFVPEEEGTCDHGRQRAAVTRWVTDGARQWFGAERIRELREHLLAEIGTLHREEAVPR